MKVTKEQIQENFKLLNGSASGAVKAYSSIACLLPGGELRPKVEDNRTPSFVSSLPQQMWRYAALCLSRVWDTHKDAISAMKICGQIDQHSLLKNKHEYEAAKLRIFQLDETDPRIDELRIFRARSLGHSDPRLGFQDGKLDKQLYGLLHESCEVLDKLHAVVLDYPNDLTSFLEVRIEESTTHWSNMLSQFFED